MPYESFEVFTMPVCVCAFARVCVCVCLCVWLCVCLCVCLYLCAYVRVHLRCNPLAHAVKIIRWDVPSRAFWLIFLINLRYINVYMNTCMSSQIFVGCLYEYMYIWDVPSRGFWLIFLTNLLYTYIWAYVWVKRSVKHVWKYTTKHVSKIIKSYKYSHERIPNQQIKITQTVHHQINDSWDPPPNQRTNTLTNKLVYLVKYIVCVFFWFVDVCVLYNWWVL